ncbi:hypothetical protein AgCh_022378 [Apium graveolens]
MKNAGKALRLQSDCKDFMKKVVSDSLLEISETPKNGVGLEGKKNSKLRSGGQGFHSKRILFRGQNPDPRGQDPDRIILTESSFDQKIWGLNSVRSTGQLEVLTEFGQDPDRIILTENIFDQALWDHNSTRILTEWIPGRNLRNGKFPNN